jgi:hypothetical protein
MRPPSFLLACFAHSRLQTQEKPKSEKKRSCECKSHVRIEIKIHNHTRKTFKEKKAAKL